MPEGQVARTPEAAGSAARALGPVVAVKAQVRIGGRGKAGGVKVVSNPEDAEKAAEAILALTIKGYPVLEVLVEAGVDIASESYFSILLDRTTKSHLAIASSKGGMDIEAVAAETPEAITRVSIDPLIGLQTFQVNRILGGLGIPAASRKQGADVVRRLYRLYTEAEATLVEVNPLHSHRIRRGDGPRFQGLPRRLGALPAPGAGRLRRHQGLRFAGVEGRPSRDFRTMWRSTATSASSGTAPGW